MHQILSQPTLGHLLNAVGDGAWLFDVRSGKVQTAGTLVRKLGYSEAEVPRTMADIMKLFHPDDRLRLIEALAAMEEGRTERCDVEQRCLAKDGRWRWVRVQGSIISLGENGASPSILGVTSDITEQKQQELDAAEARELVSLARTNAGAGIWDVNLVSGEVRLCPVSLRMHNLPEDLPTPMTKAQWEATLEPSTGAIAFEKFEEAIRTGENFKAEYQVKETGRWILGSGKMLKDAADQPRRFVGLNQDVTDLKASKLMIAQMQNQLVHLSRVSAMGTMASTIAHELNQPLAAISLYSAAGRKMLSDEDHDLAVILQNIEDACARAGGVIRHLRAAIRRQDPVFAPVALREVVHSAMELALLEARQEGVQVDVRVPRSFFVQGDRLQLEQVVLNLVRNAVEAMEGCAPKLLRVFARRNGKSVELNVQDTGAGLSISVLNSLFEPFETTKSTGMGIGLSICRTIVEAHGGSISGQPNEGRGATFSVILPLVERKEQATTPASVHQMHSVA